MAVVLDTHAAIWYLLKSKELSPAALQVIRRATQAGEPVYVPSISLVELVYLVERGRLPGSALDRLTNALKATDSALRIASLDSDVAETIRRVPRDIVPDMPDRIIAATALHLSLPLVTRDHRIQSAGIKTIW